MARSLTHSSLLVFDIETVPDTDCARRLTGCSSDDAGKLQSEMELYHAARNGGRTFLKPAFHRVVAISFLCADIEVEDGWERYHLTGFRSGGTVEHSERQLLCGFFKLFGETMPRLVSYNGRRFDLAVLRYRAMLHGVVATPLYQQADKWDNYKSRYADRHHCDLAEVLSDYGASDKMGLHEACVALRLPGKCTADGTQVAEMHRAGRLAEIRDYCETDVLNTYLLYLRHMLHTGDVTPAAHTAAVHELYAEVQKRAEEGQAHCRAFLAQWEPWPPMQASQAS